MSAVGSGWSRLLALTVTALLVVAHPAVAHPAAAADDPRRGELWWFDVLGVEAAWEISRGDGVVVAVVDTGVQLDHPDLTGQLVVAEDGSVGRDLLEGGAVVGDPNGHGTLVAGLIAARAGNGVGVAGVAPGASILPVRVLDATGRGRASTLDAGIRWAVDNGADVVNLSLEVEETDDGPAATLVAPNAAIDYAWERGVVVVAATGNGGAAAAGYPDGAPVVLVGATDRDDELAAFSDADRADALLAPGTDMVTTWCRPREGGCDEVTRYGVGTGTSFAAPVASGVVALLLAAGLGPEQAVRVLRETAVDLGPPGPDDRFGVGRIDAAAALAAGTVLLASEGAVTPSAPLPPTPPSRTPPPRVSAIGEPVADVPGGAAPPTDDVVADAPPREPEAVPPTLLLLAVVLLLVAAAAVAREAARRPATGD